MTSVQASVTLVGIAATHELLVVSARCPQRVHCQLHGHDIWVQQRRTIRLLRRLAGLIRQCRAAPGMRMRMRLRQPIRTVCASPMRTTALIAALPTHAMSQTLHSACSAVNLMHRMQCVECLALRPPSEGVPHLHPRLLHHPVQPLMRTDAPQQRRCAAHLSLN